MKYVGIDVGGTNLKAGLVDEHGAVLSTAKMKIAQLDGQEELARTMADLTCQLADMAGVAMEEIASVGVGVPGTVEIHSGSLLYSCNLPLRNVPLRRLFHKHLRMPLYIENDANCAALAEYYVGAGRGSKRFVMVTLGTGIGGGIILRPPRLLGAVCFRHCPETAGPGGAGTESRQHSRSGSSRKQRHHQRTVRFYCGQEGRPRWTADLPRVYRLSVCRYHQSGQHIPA